MARWVRRLAFLLRRRRHEDELAEEMAVHREMARELLERDGLSTAAARDASQRAFGSDALAMNRARDVWVLPWFQDISQDLRFAVRMLVKDWRFTVAAVAALALGIGVNASVFAVINAALLKDMPFDDAGRSSRSTPSMRKVAKRACPSSISRTTQWGRRCSQAWPHRPAAR